MSIPPWAKLALGVLLIAIGVIVVATDSASVVGAVVLIVVGGIHVAEGIERRRS